jgi:hypothetical protein
MGSFADYRTRAAELRQQAESARGEGVRADLIHLAERFEKLAGRISSDGTQSKAGPSRA